MNARRAQGRADFGVLFRRDIDADHAIHACFAALLRKPFRAADQHGIGIAHEDQRYMRVAGAEGGGEVENVLRLRA